MPSFTHLTAEKANQMTPEWSFRNSWPTINQYVTSAFSCIYQYAISALPNNIEEKPFFLKAQEETHFQHYLGWCDEVKKVEHWLLMQLEEKSIHPIAFRKALLVPQKKFRTSIVSPVYYQQRLEVLEQKILRLTLPTLFRDAVSEARVRFKEILQANPEAALHYFYNDSINQLIQLSGRQLLPDTFLEALKYYEGLVPEKIYQNVMKHLQHFIGANREKLTTIDDLYLEHCVSNKDYKTLLTAINAVFMTEIMPSEPFEKSEVEAPQALKITPRFVAAAAAAASVGALISYGLLNSNIDFQNAWTWIQDAFEQTAKGAWPEPGYSAMPLTALLTQVSVGYGLYQRGLSSFHPILWGSQLMLSVPSGAMAFGPQFDLADLNGKNGFIVVSNYDRFHVVTPISSGDINGDGITDLLISDPDGDYNRGQVYVIYGSRNPFSARFNLTSLNGANGFRVNGISNFDFSGSSIGSGDIDGDGIADLLLSAPGARQIYVVFGSRNPFPANFNLTSLNDTNGFRVNGISDNDGYGGSSISSGDINGDGIADLLIGDNGKSQSYVVFGSRNPFPANFNLTSLNGANGFRVNGIYDDYPRESISSGDINGDGITDLLLGAGSHSVITTGGCYVVFGSRNPFPANFNLTSLNGANGFRVNGISNDGSGRSISSGDINGDGIADLLIAAPYAKSFQGQSYVVFGSRNPFPANFNLTSLNGANGFGVNGISYLGFFGIAISSGDINGDNITDLLLGAPNSAKYLQGQSYVVFGSRNPFPANFNLTSLNGANGFSVFDRIFGTGDTGALISSGDINGDGIADLLLGGTIMTSGGGGASLRGYVIFGENNSSFATTGTGASLTSNHFTTGSMTTGSITTSSVTTGTLTTNLFTTGSVTTGPMTTGDSTTMGTSDIGTTGSNSISSSSSTASNQISSSTVNKADKGLIGGIVAGSLMLIICIGGTAFYLYQRQKRQHQSPESQPLLEESDFQAYNSFNLSDEIEDLTDHLSSEEMQTLSNLQLSKIQVMVPEESLSAENKLKEQVKNKASVSSSENAVPGKIYTPNVKQTFFNPHANAKNSSAIPSKATTPPHHTFESYRQDIDQIVKEESKQNESATP